MKLTAERDIRDMDNLIDDLESAARDLNGIVDRDISNKLWSVISEWKDCTKPLIEQLAEEEA